MVVKMWRSSVSDNVLSMSILYSDQHARQSLALLEICKGRSSKEV
jgi:hypothetical protein